jgi:hypothetical protein
MSKAFERKNCVILFLDPFPLQRCVHTSSRSCTYVGTFLLLGTSFLLTMLLVLLITIIVKNTMEGQ